mmetsp:Transcript_41333/g.130052  ORF Transcript_41333/g.130052 Transcript_41333/m.130052 type:complete len:85 (+) Transcript_41333:34-288(+)
MITKLVQQMLQFTGMGGPMGVYDEYDTGVCGDGGTNCVARDNEGYYGLKGVDPSLIGDDGSVACPPAFDCNGVAPQFWHPNNYI